MHRKLYIQNIIDITYWLFKFPIRKNMLFPSFIFPNVCSRVKLMLNHFDGLDGIFTVHRYFKF